MDLRPLFSESPDAFPLPDEIRARYGPFGFFALPDNRPYLTSNFVTGLDGVASFREFPGQTGGNIISRSAADRWLMDFYRAHSDAQIIGANTLREEPGADGNGWDYRIEDPELIRYRRDVLRLPRQKVIVVSGVCEVGLRYNVFNSEAVEAWIVTSGPGKRCVWPQCEKHPNPPKVISIGEGRLVDVKEMMRRLREEGVRTLLCEGGPNLHGQFIGAGLVDEEFRTIAAQIPGRSTQPDVARPTPYGAVSFTPETAPWFRIVSVHLSLPSNLFLRLARR